MKEGTLEENSQVPDQGRSHHTRKVCLWKMSHWGISHLRAGHAEGKLSKRNFLTGTLSQRGIPPQAGTQQVFVSQSQLPNHRHVRWCGKVLISTVATYKKNSRRELSPGRGPAGVPAWFPCTQAAPLLHKPRNLSECAPNSLLLRKETLTENSLIQMNCQWERNSPQAGTQQVSLPLRSLLKLLQI